MAIFVFGSKKSGNACTALSAVLLLAISLALLSWPLLAQDSTADAAQAAPGTDQAAAAAATANDKPAVEDSKKTGMKKRHRGAHSKKSKNFKLRHRKSAKPAASKKNKRPVAVASDEVSQPSEMILAIKNRSEREFWHGKQPLKEQGKSAPSTNAAALTRINASEVAGVSFDDQPLRMPDSEAFRRSLDTVSFELGRPCRTQEHLGWPLQQSEQARVNAIFNDTLARLRARGFGITPQNPHAAGKDVSVFTADRFDRHILGIWSAGDVGLLLLLCDTEMPKEYKTAPVKGGGEVALVKPSGKRAARKVSAKKTAVPAASPTAAPTASPAAISTVLPTQRPEVIPGASGKEQNTNIINSSSPPVPDAPAPATIPDKAAPAASPVAPAPSTAFVPAPDATAAMPQDKAPAQTSAPNADKPSAPTPTTAPPPATPLIMPTTTTATAPSLVPTVAPTVAPGIAPAVAPTVTSTPSAPPKPDTSVLAPPAASNNPSGTTGEKIKDGAAATP